jgi:transketolase
MRNAFADELTILAGKDPRIVMLSGDIGNKLFDSFKNTCPDRFINCGVAEQGMTGLAAGLAMSGLRPVTYTIAPFATTRCLEQIRTDVAYHDLPVTIVSVGAGLAYAGLGPTHHACEDIAFLRAIPNMIVLCPGDAWEVRAALQQVFKQNRPAYIRMGKKGEPLVHSSLPSFEIGKVIQISQGAQICLMSTGNMLPEAVEAGRQLEAAGYSVEVVSFHTVKPLDDAYLYQVLNRFSVIATIEEHSLIGGFGAAIAEWMVDRGQMPERFFRFGTPDAFFKKSGEQEFAREELCLNGHAIARHILSGLELRKRS